MATRALFCTKNDDGLIIYSYNHSDGYPEHLGIILKENYKTKEDVLNLLSKGNASSIGETIEDSRFYDEELYKPISNIEDLYNGKRDVDQEYVYFFNDSNEWTYLKVKRNKNLSNQFKKL